MGSKKSMPIHLKETVIQTEILPEILIDIVCEFCYDFISPAIIDSNPYLSHSHLHFRLLNYDDINLIYKMHYSEFQIFIDVSKELKKKTQQKFPLLEDLSFFHYLLIVIEEYTLCTLYLQKILCQIWQQLYKLFTDKEKALDILASIVFFLLRFPCYYSKNLLLVFIIIFILETPEQINSDISFYITCLRTYPYASIFFLPYESAEKDWIQSEYWIHQKCEPFYGLAWTDYITNISYPVHAFYTFWNHLYFEAIPVGDFILHRFPRIKLLRERYESCWKFITIMDPFSKKVFNRLLFS
jgi:hypothetical protein